MIPHELPTRRIPMTNSFFQQYHLEGTIAFLVHLKKMDGPRWAVFFSNISANRGSGNRDVTWAHHTFQHPTLSICLLSFTHSHPWGSFHKHFVTTSNSADEMSPPKDANNQSLCLEIAFDRPSRTYHPGERVTGKLIVNPNGISPVHKQTKMPVQG